MKRYLIGIGLILLMLLGACGKKEKETFFGNWVVEKDGAFQVQDFQWGDDAEIIRKAYPDEKFEEQDGELIGSAHTWNGAEYRIIYTFQSSDLKDLGSARISITCTSADNMTEVLKILYEEAKAAMPDPMTDGGFDTILEKEGDVSWEGQDGSLVFLHKMTGQNVIGIQVTMPEKEGK